MKVGVMQAILIKDATRGGVVPLGEGEVDLKAVVKALRNVGYDDYLVLETRLDGDRLDGARRDLEYTRHVLQSVK